MHNSKTPVPQCTLCCLLGLWQGDCKWNGSNRPVGCRERGVVYWWSNRPNVIEIASKTLIKKMTKPKIRPPTESMELTMLLRTESPQRLPIPSQHGTEANGILCGHSRWTPKREPRPKSNMPISSSEYYSTRRARRDKSKTSTMIYRLCSFQWYHWLVNLMHYYKFYAYWKIDLILGTYA